MLPDTKKIIEEIPDLTLDENFNDSRSDQFGNNSSTELKLNLSHEEIARIIINQRFLNDTVIHYFQKLIKNFNGLQDPNGRLLC